MPDFSSARFRLVRRVLRLILLGCVLPLAAEASEQTRILVLNSYHRGFQWTDTQVEGFEAAVAERFPRTLFFTEYVDAKRFPLTPEYIRELADVLAFKFRNVPPSLVYATDDIALDIAYRQVRERWPGVPIVASGVNAFEGDPEPRAGGNNVYIAHEADNSGEAISMALTLHPGIRRIVVIQDATDVGREIGSVVAGAARKITTLPVVQTEPMPYAELLDTVRRSPADTLFILVLFTQDSDGEFVDCARVSEEVADVARGPVYVTNELHFHGPDIVGGQVHLGQTHGRAAAQLAIQLLEGAPASELSNAEVVATDWQFNYPALRRFGVPQSRLPPGSRVFHEPQTLFHQHPLLLALGFIGVAAQTLLIVYLLLNIRRRREITHALRQREEQLQRLIEHSPLAVLITDSNRRVTYINSKHFQTFNYSVEELGDFETFMTLCFPEPAQRARVADRWLTELDTARAEGRDPAPQEWTITCKDGRKVDVEFYFTEIGNQGFGVINDITGHKRAQAELERASKAAQAASEAKSQFLANVSHEIRTPMNGVLGMAQLLMETNPSPDQREYIDTIRDSSQLLLTIINDLLDLSKIEAGQMTLDVKAVDAQTFIEGTTSLVESALAQKGLAFECIVEPAVPQSFRCDPNRLSQVLLNLLNNALKFTDRGRVQLIVSGSDLGGGRSLLSFQVTDTGIGISQEHLERIFLPFNQGDTSSTRKYGGTGLGLTISRRLVEMMGGSISVVSAPGKGSIFTFTARVEAVPAVAAVKLEERIDANLARRYPLRILVAEDNPVNQKVALMVLGKMGYAADLAANGREALERLREHRYDVILMDVQMPEMDGLTAARAIRSEFPRDHQPLIIALTAHAMNDDIARCREAGMDDYLSKPLRVPRLGDALIKAYAVLVPSAG